MGGMFVGRAAVVALIGLYLSGCTTMGQNAATSTASGQQVAAVQGTAAIDADIQRILAAGGIQAAPQLPVAPPTAPASQVAVAQQPTPEQQTAPSAAAQPTFVANAQDPAARLDFSALPVTDGTTEPITSTTATYDFSGQVSRPQMAGLMMPQAVPGVTNASVSAGILPSVPVSNVVTDVTGDTAQPVAQRPRRAVVPVMPLPMPAQIAAIRQGGAVRPQAAPTIAALQPSLPVTPSAVAPAVVPVVLATEVNTDKPLQPIKRF